MKMPKEIEAHCPFCNKHTTHTVERVRRGQARSMTRIARQKARANGTGNQGKFSKVPGGDKPTKRVNLRYRCSKCKKAHNRKGIRLGRFDLVEG
ncbi:MAG: 50S ribosomal protein L44e [Methanothrix sp.]|uniref:50S ribosomal protein L44e n=1 Tax=Methanothrix sp. TaxID=90426 RepID=UPI0025CC23DB|nr:50S ribosomal protein L44e [Methanothrix sp.]MCQ8903499.1 50S ribosomal protein L44e [Methanothrix sp.]